MPGQTISSGRVSWGHGDDEEPRFARDVRNVVHRLSEHLDRMGAANPTEREMLSQINEMLHELRTKLTDMKPDWLPDGEPLVIVSDRLGQTQVLRCAEQQISR